MHHPPERRRALAAMAGGVALTAAALGGLRSAWAQPGFDLEQLMRALAQVRAGEATFTEKRTVAMLERTLESSGRLSFEAPDTFVRETLKPRRERVAVVGNTMTMSLGQRSRTMPLDSVPEAAVIMEAIRGTLTGNRDAIERHFSATVSGTAQRWLLELVPREPRLREQVISVRVAGQQALVREVTVALADGDRSVMSIEPATAAPRGASNPANPANPASAPSAPS
jgi:outer membrane lipoprotein-sorting protein